MVCSKCPHHVAKLPLSLSPSLPACSEILRTIDSLQLTAYKKVATPANWKVNACIGWLLWIPAVGCPKETNYCHYSSQLGRAM